MATLVLIGLGLVPDTYVNAVAGPEWAVRWADDHDFLRHFFGFGLVTFLWAVALGFCSRRSEGQTNRRTLWRWVCLLGLIALPVLLEVAQLAVPRRAFDWMDVLAGSLGVFLGLTLPCVRKLFPARVETDSDGKNG